MDVFKPEEAHRFTPFRKQKKVIAEMGDIVAQHDADLTDPDLFWFALTETHDWLDPYFQDWPPNLLYIRFQQEFVKSAGRDVKGLVNRYLRPFKTQLSRHLTERVALDPMRLLREATSPPDETSTRSIRYRKFADCHRRMAIALQYFPIEIIDSDAWSSDDLLRVDDLSYERLFDPGEDRILWVTALPDPSKNGRVKGRVWLFEESRKMRNWIETRSKCMNVYWDKFNCRLVRDGNRTYIVWVDGRWKESRATLLKLERGRDLTDRRGWKFVVVAVEERGEVRRAQHADAVRFNELCRERLWTNPLVLHPPKNGRNSGSHPEYKDEKIVGRIESLRPVQGYVRRVSAQVEQLTLSIDHHINTITSTDGVNHEIYRGKEIVRTFCPLWFPFSVYGVDWPTFPKKGEPPDRSPRKLETQRILEEWWRSQVFY